MAEWDWLNEPPAPHPFVPWKGVAITCADARRMLAAVGADFEIVGLGDVEGRVLLEWLDAWIVHKNDADYVTVVAYIADHGFEQIVEREIEIRSGRTRLHSSNGELTSDTPLNDTAVPMWRIEDAEGNGPFRPGPALSAMNLAMTGDADSCWHQANMPTPYFEGLDQFRHLRCATPSPRELVRWFPRAARRALAPHGYRVTRMVAAPGSSQTGITQMLYNPRRAQRVSTRAL